MNKSYAKFINGKLHYALSMLCTPGGIIMNPKQDAVPCGASHGRNPVAQIGEEIDPPV